MRNGNNILTIDIGTSGCRSVLFSGTGSILSAAEQQYGYIPGAEGFVEQDPDEIFRKFILTAKKCLKNGDYKAKYAIISSVLHSLILLDRNDVPLTPMSIWADTRSIPQCKEMKSFHYRKALQQKTGCPLSPSYPVARLLWYRENQPKVFKKINRIASIKSYILLKLTGLHIEDCSVASGTGIFDINTRDWSAEVIDYLGLKHKMLPEVVPVEQNLGSLSPRYRASLGCGYTAFIAGAADGPLAHLGSAGRISGVASLTIGTSGAVRILSTKPALCADTTRWCYILDESSYVSGYSTNNGGNVIDWYVKNFLGAKTGWPDLDKTLESTHLDKNLFFSPFLLGERTISANASSRAGFSGIEAKHNHNDLLRAIIEGVVFNIVSMFEHLKPDHGNATVFTTGSLTKSSFVRSVLASLIKETRFNGCGVHEGLLSIIRQSTQDELRLQGGNATADPNGKKAKALNVSDYTDKFERWKQLLNCKTRILNNPFTYTAKCSS